MHPQTIHVIAESVAVGQLSDEAAKALAPHVDVRLREVVQVRFIALHVVSIILYKQSVRGAYVLQRGKQDAAKFMRHAKRGTLTTEDINNALRLRNVQVCLGKCLAAIDTFLMTGDAANH